MRWHNTLISAWFIDFLCMVLKVISFCIFNILFSFNQKKNNVLRILLTLECIVLLIFLFISFSSEIFFSVIFLRVGACEAAVGLGCLVGLTRLWGETSILLTEYDSKLYFIGYLFKFFTCVKYNKIFLYLGRSFTF